VRTLPLVVARRSAPSAQWPFLRACSLLTITRQKPNTQTTKQQWEKVENKTGFILYSAGAFLAVWFSSTLVTALNSIPLLPKFMELVGLGYTSWFGECECACWWLGWGWGWWGSGGCFGLAGNRGWRTIGGKKKLTPARAPEKNANTKKQSVYRYLLFKSSREELVKDVDDLKKKITGEL
jgi:hypothetical protein